MDLEKWDQRNQEEIDKANRRGNNDLWICILIFVVIAFSFVGCQIQVVPGG